MEIIHKEQKMQCKILFSEEQIKTRVREIAHAINKDLGSQEPLVILIVLNGAFIFAADLVRHLDMPTEIETIRLKSYEGTSSTGTVQLINSLPANLAGRNVLVIEDIVETGRTLAFLLNELKKQNVKSLKICSLLDKKELHESPIALDYIGFPIGKNFVIGYGLDLDEKYRNLPYLAELL